MSSTKRLKVLKTYKLFIGGAFPRTESGRYYKLQDSKGGVVANICQSSRKDVRNAIVAARSALKGWASATAFNRGQILYRVAEMLDGRRDQFIDELKSQGLSQAKAEKEADVSIDRCIYFAGWTDKYQQVFSSVNPVAAPYFNFSVPKESGVVFIAAPEKSGLAGLVSVIASTIAGGNTCVVLASESLPLCSITLGEVLHSSDVPGGVVNILTGKKQELVSGAASHMDINAIIYCDSDHDLKTLIQTEAVSNLKRVIFPQVSNWTQDSDVEHPYHLLDTQEIQTTWHPIGI